MEELAQCVIVPASGRYGAVGVLCLAIGAGVCLAGDPEGEKPLDLRIQEQTGRRLAQIDVTVDGPPDLVDELRPEDFEVAVGGRVIESFLVDGMCDGRQPARPDEPADEASRIAPPPGPEAPPTNILFYFDQPHLTMAGRQRSLDVSRKLVSELKLAFRATVVSSGRNVLTVTPLTSERSRLLEGFDQLEHDLSQWDPYPGQEQTRVEEVMRVLDELGHVDALRTADRLQREEVWRTEKALRRFEMVLGRFVSLDPPNVVIYFADTMRSQPGAHYLSLFPTATKLRSGPRRMQQKMGLRAFGSSSVYDRVINAASSHAVRLYTVQAEGLVAQPMPLYSGSARNTIARAHPVPGAVRLASAQDGLGGWAAETGGRTFLNGVRPARMARQIEQDLSCMYLISFDASLVSQSRSLAVSVRVTRPGVSTRTRGRLYVPTESQLLTSRLMTAFLGTDEEPNTPLKLHGAVAPMDFRNGKYAALIHVVTPEINFPGAVWDVGASLLSRDTVRDEAAGHVGMSHPGMSLVLEAEMTIPPGRYEVVMVAHEYTTDQILRGRIEGALVDPSDEGAVIPSIAILQTSRESVVHREGEAIVSGEGRIACGDPCRVRTDETTAIISLVCRGKRKGRSAWVTERFLEGETAVEFPPQTVEFEKGDQCVQLRDFIPENTLGQGKFVYEVRVVEGGQELAAARRELYAIESAGETANTR